MSVSATELKYMIFFLILTKQPTSKIEFTTDFVFLVCFFLKGLPIIN